MSECRVRKAFEEWRESRDRTIYPQYEDVEKIEYERNIFGEYADMYMNWAFEAFMAGVEYSAKASQGNGKS